MESILEAFRLRVKNTLDEKGKSVTWLMQQLGYTSKKPDATYRAWFRNKSLRIFDIIQICEILEINTHSIFVMQKNEHNHVEESEVAYQNSKHEGNNFFTQKNMKRMLEAEAENKFLKKEITLLEGQIEFLKNQLER